MEKVVTEKCDTVRAQHQHNPQNIVVGFCHLHIDNVKAKCC